MSSQSHRRTLPLATALLALALTTPAVPAIAAGNTSGEPPPPNFPTAVPTRRGALTQPADTHASVAPAATNAHRKRNRRSADANVGSSRPVPVDPKVAYASYWGGSGAEGCQPTSGADGSLYVTCGTDSPNLPRVGGIQSYQGQEDGYVAKLDRTGKHIIYATYLGSPGDDEIDSAAVDARGHLYVSGFAANGFPTTPGAFDTTFNGAGDAFVAELSADGSRLLYSTFIGGSSTEAAPALALDHDGSVVIVGNDRLRRFPDHAWSGRVDVPRRHRDVRGRADRRVCRQARSFRLAARLLDLPRRLR